MKLNTEDHSHYIYLSSCLQVKKALCIQQELNELEMLLVQVNM